MTHFKLLSQRSKFKFPSVIASISLLIVLTGTSCQKSTVNEQKPVTISNVADASVKIGTQRWMTTNLNVTRYRNGDVIPQVQNHNKWDTLTTGAWCYLNNDTANRAVYGKLYNWAAVNDPRGLAPAGWHIPSDSEWTLLSLRLGGDSVAGGKMKDTGTIEAGTGLWLSPNTGATNSSGFTGLPGGWRTPGGAFLDQHDYGFWWTSTPKGGTISSWSRYLDYSDAYLGRTFDKKRYGFSVRCIKD